MFRCWCRIAEILYGEALEERGILADSGHDVWMVDNESFHLVDDSATQLASEFMLLPPILSWPVPWLEKASLPKGFRSI